MFRFRSIRRVAAAAALVAGGVAVATVAPTMVASATNTAITANCPSTTAPSTINNSDTITFTVGSGCQQVMIGMGALGSAVVNGTFTLNPGAPIGVSPGDTVVYTAPSTGSSTDQMYFLVSTNPSAVYDIHFPIPTPPAPRVGDSLTDNHDGSVTITYEPTTGMQSFFVNMWASGTTCPSSPPFTNRLYVLSPSAPTPLAASPAVVMAGTAASLGVSPYSATTIAAGSYQMCMYFSSGQGVQLEQSLAVTLGSVSPTTTTPGTPVTPTITG